MISTLTGFLMAVSRMTGADKSLAKALVCFCFRYHHRKIPGRQKRIILSKPNSIVGRKDGKRYLLVLKETTNVCHFVQNALDRCLEATNPLKNLCLDEESEDCLDVILDNCYFHRPVSFWLAVPFWKQAFAVKVAEGSFGDIYLTRSMDGSPRILKFIPVHGNHPDCDYANLTIAQVLPDVICSKYLSDLKQDGFNSAQNFPRLYRASLVKGAFPAPLMNAWMRYNQRSRSDALACLPRPDKYEKDQLFVMLEMENCGADICRSEAIFINDAVACVIGICQVAAALAVAEKAYNFEHRDLHLANILVKRTSENKLHYTLGGKRFTVDTCGYHFYIIDYTMSRITTDQRTYYTALGKTNSEDNVDFSQEWIEHTAIYQIQSQLFNEGWNCFKPRTNLFWIKYLLENLISLIVKDMSYFEMERDQAEATELLKIWRDSLLQYTSATEFLLNGLMNKIKYVVGLS